MGMLFISTRICKKNKKKEPIELIYNRLKFLIELTIEETLYKSEILYN